MYVTSRQGGTLPAAEAKDRTKTCTHGVKAFCCEGPDFKDLIKGCYWANW
jgi:hypothetical protein